MEKKRILLVSDVHICFKDFYGVPTAERMERLVRHIWEEHEKDPFAMILFLGDYSLDFWPYQVKGSWLEQGRSDTAEFVRTYCPKLPSIPRYMIAGNHELYGEELWREITGCGRNLHVVFEDYLFVLWDSFAGILDPDYHCDGAYSPMPLAWIRGLMEQYPNKKVILCAHYFHPSKETDVEGVNALLREDRVICLFAGHTHKADVWTLAEERGAKKMLFTGNYSYHHHDGIKTDPGKYPWGFRDLYVDDHTLLSRYITPENEIFIGEDKTPYTVPYGTMEEVKLTF